MKAKTSLALLAFTLTLTCGHAALADSKKSIKKADEDMRASMRSIEADETAFHQLIDDAAVAYKKIAKSSDEQIPAQVLNQARCIAILPDVTAAALLTEGAHGDGLASCKTSKGTWSQPAALTLHQGSLGLKTGSPSADIVLFFQSEDAANALKKGNFTLGKEFAAETGSYSPQSVPGTAKILAYAQTKGDSREIKLAKNQINHNQESLDKFYGQKVNYELILEGKESPDSSGYTQKLTSLFP